MERLCIYPKDIQVVTGRSERYGRNLIRKIKETFSMKDHHLVTIDEFCLYTGLSSQQEKEKLKTDSDFLTVSYLLNKSWMLAGDIKYLHSLHNMVLHFAWEQFYDRHKCTQLIYPYESLM